jgi:hypothetical protein
MENEKDLATCVLESGGNQILDPFDFINYSPPDAIPSASSQPTSRIAGSTSIASITSSNVPEQLQNTISTSQKARRPLPIRPTVPV